MQTFQGVFICWYKDTLVHTQRFTVQMHVMSLNCTRAQSLTEPSSRNQSWKRNMSELQSKSLHAGHQSHVRPPPTQPPRYRLLAAQALNFQVIFLHSREIKWVGTKRKRQGEVPARRERMMKEDRKSVTNVSCWNIQHAAAWCVTRSRNGTYSTTMSSHVHARSWSCISPLCDQNPPQLSAWEPAAIFDHAELPVRALFWLIIG